MADETKTCPTCDGTGKILDGNRKCPDCDGTGEIPVDDRGAQLLAYGAQVRAKYNAAALKALKAKGHTLPGTTSYPIDDAEDLDNAIQAVGRGGADHDTIRKYIIGRAKAMGLSDKVPDNWNADGSLADANSANLGAHRAAPTDEDWDVSYGLEQVKKQLAGVKAKQLADPDLKTDPDDTAVMAAIEKADAALDKAIVAQSKDAHPDKPQSNSATWPTPKRALSSFVEQSPAHAVPIEVRMVTDDHAAQFVGYASTTNERYDVTDWLGEYGEKILPGAFAKTLREQPAIPLLFNHDGMPIASTGSGTSRLSEDAKGLRNEAALDRRQGLTNDLCIGLQRGDVNKMSFSFRAIKDDWNDDYDERAVSELRLFDTSLVTYPANPGTSGELLDAMRSALGREGLGLMWSLRSALPAMAETRELPDAAGDALEHALKAIFGADEALCRGYGPHGRARTFLVARAILDVRETRAGKVLSTANQSLLQKALDALTAADKQHQKLAASHSAAADALSTVLGSASGMDGNSNGSGMDGNQGPGNGNPINPQDGAGPRSARALRHRREVEIEDFARR